MEGLSSLLGQVVDNPQVETAIVTFDSQVSRTRRLSSGCFSNSFTDDPIAAINESNTVAYCGDTGSAAIYDAVRYSALRFGRSRM
jgi:hypothetical protein